MAFNKLYCVLLLHLLLIDDSVLVARGEATNNLRSRKNNVQTTEQSQDSSLSKKFRTLSGSIPSLHLENDTTAATIKTVFHDFSNDVKMIRNRFYDRRPPLDPGGTVVEVEKQVEVTHHQGDEEPYPRRRLTMILAVASSSPSVIAKQGVMISASMQQLHVAYKTIGKQIRQSGNNIKHGIVVTVQSIGKFLNKTFQFTKRQSQKTIAMVIISIMNALHFMTKKVQGVMHRNKKKGGLVADTCPSTPPVMSRFCSASPSSTPSLSTATSWLSSSSSEASTATAPVVTKSSPVKQKSQPVSVKQMTSSSYSSKAVNADKSLQVVPESTSSLLGGLFQTLVGGLLVLSTGAIVGYFWSSDWRETRLHATSQEFFDPDAIMMNDNHASVAIPISPDSSRY